MAKGKQQQTADSAFLLIQPRRRPLRLFSLRALAAGLSRAVAAVPYPPPPPPERPPPPPTPTTRPAPSSLAPEPSTTTRPSGTESSAPPLPIRSRARPPPPPLSLAASASPVAALSPACRHRHSTLLHRPPRSHAASVGRRGGAALRLSRFAPAAAFARCLRPPACRDSEREMRKGEKRGREERRLTCGAHVGPTLTQLPRGIKPGSKPLRDLG
jgi:hypothetical protein